MKWSRVVSTAVDGMNVVLRSGGGGSMAWHSMRERIMCPRWVGESSSGRA